MLALRVDPAVQGPSRRPVPIFWCAAGLFLRFIAPLDDESTRRHALSSLGHLEKKINRLLAEGLSRRRGRKAPTRGWVGDVWRLASFCLLVRGAGVGVREAKERWNEQSAPDGLN